MEQPILPFVAQYKKYYRSLEPMLQTPKGRSYSTIIFFILVLSLFGWYAIKPTIQTILYLQREIKDKVVLTKKMDDKIQALIQAQTAYENATDLLPFIGQALPNNSDVVPLLKSLTLSAEISGATVSAVQMTNIALTKDATASVKTSGNVALPITLSVDGNYASLRTFLDNLISLRRIIRINSLQFAQAAPTKTGSGSAQLTNTLRLMVSLHAYTEN